MAIPSFIKLPQIIELFVDKFAEIKEIIPERHLTEALIDERYIPTIKDLKCWIKHFYHSSSHSELSKIKALQRCVNLLLRLFKAAWREYFFATEDQEIDEDDRSQYVQMHPPTFTRKFKYIELFRAILQLIDWLCLNNKFIFIFNEESGRTNLKFIMNTCNIVLGQFRRPVENEGMMPNMEDLTFNDKVNRGEEAAHNFDLFPLTEIGAIL